MKHVMFCVSSLFGGGAERVVSVWANKLCEKGYDVSIMMYSRMENEYPINENIDIYTIANSQEECNNMNIIKRVSSFRKILKKVKPDVLINFLPVIQVYINIASFGLGIPRIETIRINPWKAELNETKYAFLWKRCFENSSVVILQSKDQKAFFSKKVQEKSVVIPNPVNELYINNPKKQYDGLHNLVAAGRITEQKNYDMMIDAVKIVSKDYPDVCLKIYGEGDLTEKLSEKIKKCGLSENVFLMGRSSKLYEEYIKNDVFLMSSDYEGMPNALAEAMSVGLLCVSTDCKTGPRDLIDNEENGFLVSVGDSKEMADRIIKIFKLSPDEQRKLGEKAREKILSFCSEENSINKLCELVDSIK